MTPDEYQWKTPGRFERGVAKAVNGIFALFIFLTRA